MKQSLHLLPALELARVVQGEVSSTTPLNNNVRVHERYLEPAIAEQGSRLAGWPLWTAQYCNIWRWRNTCPSSATWQKCISLLVMQR